MTFYESITFRIAFTSIVLQHANNNNFSMLQFVKFDYIRLLN